MTSLLLIVGTDCLVAVRPCASRTERVVAFLGAFGIQSGLLWLDLWLLVESLALLMCDSMVPWLDGDIRLEHLWFTGMMVMVGTAAAMPFVVILLCVALLLQMLIVYDACRHVFQGRQKIVNVCCWRRKLQQE